MCKQWSLWDAVTSESIDKTPINGLTLVSILVSVKFKTRKLIFTTGVSYCGKEKYGCNPCRECKLKSMDRLRHSTQLF
jgi:hypothetical protein